MKKHIVILDPFPRTLKLIFSKDKFKKLKLSYKLIYAPKMHKKNFYEKKLKLIHQYIKLVYVVCFVILR